MPLFYFSPKLPKVSFSRGWCEPKGARSEGSFRDTIVESHQMPGGQSPAGRLSVNLAKVEGQGWEFHNTLIQANAKHSKKWAA